MQINGCTPYPWLVCITYADSGPVFAISEHTQSSIEVDRDFWPEERDNFAGVLPKLIGVARIIASAPSMYELLKETLEWLDDKFPEDKYPLDLDNHYRNRCDLAVARRRESIRSIIALIENWQHASEECYA